MEIKECISIDRGDIESRKVNIFIPICLGNRFFSERGLLNQNVAEYLNWSLEHTKEKVLFLVVDKIQNTNYYVRNHNTSESASLKHVLKDGEIIKNALEELVIKLPEDKKSRVTIIKWEDYEKADTLSIPITNKVYDEFKNNPDFKESVLAAVKTSVTDRKFSEDDYIRLCNYVLDEFCVIYSGIQYKNDYFGLYIYPDTDSVLNLIEKIKSGDIFTELQIKLPAKKTGVAILNK